ALAWLAGDFTGSGKTEIAQLWDNNGRLGLIVYGADSGGSLATVFGSADMGQGSGALAWLAGDFTGSGKTEMVFTQLAKRAVRPFGGGREDVADLDVAVGDDHTVDEQLSELAPLVEGGGGQAGADGAAECLDAVG